MKKLFVLALTSALAQSAPFTLKDVGTGATYQCGPGSAGTTDPACVQNVADFCNHNSGYDETTCFNRASTACAHGMNADCVPQTANYCNHNTGYDQTTCFNKAIDSCSGNGLAIQDLAESARLKFIRDFNQRALGQKASE